MSTFIDLDLDFMPSIIKGNFHLTRNLEKSLNVSIKSPHTLGPASATFNTTTFYISNKTNKPDCKVTEELIAYLK